MERPVTVTVFGVLNIVFGALGLIGSTFGAAFWLFGRPILERVMPDHPMLTLMDAAPGFALFTTASLALGAAAALLLLIAGIGLLRLRPWARYASIGYALYAILSGLAGIVINLLYVYPAMWEQLEASEGGPAGVGMMGGAMGGVMGGIIGTLAALAYPVLLLIFMNRPGVRAAFGAAQSRSDASTFG